MHRTAMSRHKVSRPTQWICNNVDLAGMILHYGEGRAYPDTAAMREYGLVVTYEPYPAEGEEWKASMPRVPDYYDFVVCNYVLNVLKPKERREAIQIMCALGERVIVSVRTDKIRGKSVSDGVVTAAGTFQKSYTDYELKQLGHVLHKGQGFGIVEIEDEDCL